MLPSVKAGFLLAAGLSGTAFLCPLCGGGIQTAGAQNAPVAAQAPDTATVRLHISRMTCGSCPTTARLALKKLPGVYGATVTLDDSLGVVRYDPRQVTPRSEEHTSELQSRPHLVCRLLLEKKKKILTSHVNLNPEPTPFLRTRPYTKHITYMRGTDDLCVLILPLRPWTVASLCR